MLNRKIGEGGVYGLSFVLTTAVIGNAFFQKKQFYPSVVYLTKSNPSLAVLGIQALVFVVLLGKLTRKVFFGNLRAAEVEHLIEKSWYAVTETCLAFTVFRDDFNVTFVAMFTMLLFFKCFHWLAEDRVDYMERSPMLDCLFHTRMLGLIAVLGLIDCMFIKNAYLITAAKGASAQVVFGFEYAILCTIVFTIFIKYTLHCIDLSDENPWEDKAVYLLYLELVTNGWKFALYVVFVVLMSKVHTFPLFAIRPLYLTMRGFKKALSDVILSRRAIRNMNQLYPDATEEDLQAVDDCIICRDPMQAQSGCKKLPCSHIFHASCLRSWFQRQQTCPTCRMEVLRIPAEPAAPAAPAQAAAPPNLIPPPAGQAGAPPPFPWQALHQQMAAARHGRNLAPPTAPPAAASQQPTDTNTPNNQNAQQPAPPPNMQGFPGGFPQGFPAGFPARPNANMMYGAPPSRGLPGAAGSIPPIPPPGMFPFMAMPPPQMPMANIQTLTDEQLKQMETEEREALEARIQWLRDIQTLIDSAVEQMNQYTLVMSALNATRPPFRPANQSTVSSHMRPSSSVRPETLGTSADSPSQSAPDTSYMDSGARPKIRSPTPAASPLSTFTASPSGPSPAGGGGQSTGAAHGAQSAKTTPEPVSDQEELRRRRLAKFEHTPDQADN